MKITWVGNVTGKHKLELRPTWEVDEVRVHTVKNFLRPDGRREDTVVVAIMASKEQYDKLVKDYNWENIPTSILGLEVIPLLPNAILWTWKPPKGYEDRIDVASYTAFEITP